MASERIGDSGENTAADGDVARRSDAGAPAHTSVQHTSGQHTSGQHTSGQQTGSSSSSSSSGSGDPDIIVKEIEATREDLAETLDAIADKVSPKRVAARSTDRAKEVAEQAKTVLAEKAATAKTAVTQKAASAKHAVDQRRAVKANASSVAVVGSEAPADTADTASTTAGTTGSDGLPPTTGVPVPVLSPRPAHAGGTSPAGSAAAYLQSLPKEALAAGGAGALVALLLLVLRRRRRDG